MNPILNNPSSEPDDFIQDEIEKLINMMNSTHKSVQLEGLIGLRKLCSSDDNPPFQKVIDSGVVPKLLEIMTLEDESKFQIESTWCILNICSGEEKFTDYILELGGLDILINLLNSETEDVVDNAIFAICNIAGSSTKSRDACLQKDCLNKFLQTLEAFPTSNQIQSHSVLGISNLCQGKPAPDWKIILPALPVLHKHISDVHSQQALENALWSLAYISEDNIQEVIDQGCVPFLVRHLCEASQRAFAATMRTVGNLLSGTDKQTNALLLCPEFLPKLFETTTHIKKVFRKEAWWAISNIAAGTPEQIDMLIQNGDFNQRLKTAVEFEEANVKTEASWAMCNLFSSASAEQVDCIIKKHGLVESFVHILTKSDGSLKQEALEAIRTVLNHENCDFTKEIREAGLVEIMRDLAKDDEFSSNADQILQYFPEDGKEQNENNQDNSETED